MKPADMDVLTMLRTAYGNTAVALDSLLFLRAFIRRLLSCILFPCYIES
jgi:hypothetical protein